MDTSESRSEILEKFWNVVLEKISQTDHVRNKEVLHIAEEERSILQTIKRGKANWIGHILHRNFLLNQIIEGKIEVTGEKERRHKQLLDDLKETKGCCKLTDEALDCTLWRTHFGSGCRPVVEQTTE